MQGVHNKLCTLHTVQSAECTLSTQPQREQRPQLERDRGQSLYDTTLCCSPNHCTTERKTAHYGKTLEHTQKLLYTLHNTAETAEHCTTLYRIVKGLRAGQSVAKHFPVQTEKGYIDTAFTQLPFNICYSPQN